MTDMFRLWYNGAESYQKDYVRSLLNGVPSVKESPAVSILTCDVLELEQLTDGLFLSPRGKPSSPSKNVHEYAVWADRIEEWRPGTLTAKIVQALVMGKAALVRRYDAEPCRTLSGMVYEGIEFKGHPNRLLTPKCTVRRGLRYGRSTTLSDRQMEPDKPCWWLSICCSWYKGGGTKYENRNRFVRIVTHDLLGIDPKNVPTKVDVRLVNAGPEFHPDPSVPGGI